MNNTLADYFPPALRDGHGARLDASNDVGGRLKARTPPESKSPCFRCQGQGEIPLVGRGKRGGNAGTVITVRCPACKGRGA